MIIVITDCMMFDVGLVKQTYAFAAMLPGTAMSLEEKMFRCNYVTPRPDFGPRAKTLGNSQYSRSSLAVLTVNSFLKDQDKISHCLIVVVVETIITLPFLP